MRRTTHLRVQVTFEPSLPSALCGERTVSRHSIPLYDDATCARLDIPVPDRARLRLLTDAYGLDAADRAALLPTVEARLECLIATARTWGPRPCPAGSTYGATPAAASGRPG